MNQTPKSPTPRDIQRVSAYLDGQLSRSEKERLERRLKSDPALVAALEDLRQTRLLLRRTPQRRAPRNFTLTPRMAGVRPPVPRLVPAFSWASAVAMLLFIFTLGSSLLGGLSLAAQAPMQAAAPNAYGGGGLPPAATLAPALAAPAIAAPVTGAPVTGAPVTEAPVTKAPVNDSNMQATSTPEASIMSVPEATPPGALRTTNPPLITKASLHPRNPWLFIWPGLAILLAVVALLLLWYNRRSFQRKNPKN